jgi:ribosomal protein S12 methylthiotransferase
MKLGFLSLGCPKNLVDGEVMLGLAREAGHEITANAADAEVIVVNTCAFIDQAKEESVNAILEMAQLKRDGGCRRLVVTGCLGERYREQLKAEIPEIDVVLGTGDVPEIVGALNGVQPVAAPVSFFKSAGEAVSGRPSSADLRRSPPAAAPTYLYARRGW